MNYILFDSDIRNSLLPFTFTKPVADLRIGILTIREKWEHYLGFTTSTITEGYLEEKYPMVEMEENILINASFCPSKKLVKKIKNLSKNEAIFKGDDVLAFYTSDFQEEVDFETYTQIEFEDELLRIKNTWDIFSVNDKAIQQDFELLTKDRTSQSIPKTVQAINPERIFIEDGAKITFAFLNASSGPIYIGKDAEIMEGCVVRGPLAMCEHSTLKMGAKIYGATTLGPHCKVGGEVNNSVLMGYSNKGHDGFLGNSVLGEWCNLGAGTSNSNVKNTGGPISVWDESSNANRYVGNKMGVCMGDYVKTAINTSITTGATIGVGANVFCAGLTPNFIPHFCWGIDHTTYQIDKLIEDTANWKAFKNEAFSDMEKQLIRVIFESLTSNPS
jgi:UDP-N-acetylglucosamine diphosphorylase/glucosamine-1-phosphate N-acetyltransferase